MNQSEIVKKLVEKNSEMTVRDMHRVVACLITCVEDALVAGDRLEIRGFGVLQTRTIGPRCSRNPRNDESIQLEKRSYGHFKPGAQLKTALGNPAT